MGNKFTTSYFQLRNNTTLDITNTTISQIDNYDWHGDLRPDHNLKNLTIPAGTSIERRQDFNSKASHSPFAMTLIFSDGTTDQFRIHQQYATLGCDDEYVFQHFIKSHDIFVERWGDNTLIVTIEHTQEQLVNQKAEDVNKSGEKEMEKKMYEVAIRKFKTALGMANQTQTVTKISRNLERAEEIYKIHKLNEDGKELMRKKKYEEAVKKFDAALKLKSSNFDTDVIKDNKHQALNLQGLSLLEEGLNLESDENVDRSSQARESFLKARKIFESIGEQKYFKITQIKIDGNELFNQGVILQQKGLELIENTSYDAAHEKYGEALRKLEEAKRKFEEGVVLHERFRSDVKVVQSEIDGVMVVMQDVDLIELREKIKKVKVEEETAGDDEEEEKGEVKLELL